MSIAIGNKIIAGNAVVTDVAMDELVSHANEYTNKVITNSNLLINSNFKINQRGQETYTVSIENGYLYTVDN